MNKKMKILSVILIVMMTIASVSTVVLADIPSAIDKVGQGSDADTDKITDMGATIVTVLQVIGVVVAVVVLLVLGIKYMVGSAEEKAEYKKTMMPYIVGAVLIFAASTIVNIVYQMANSLNG